jgi:2-polyprenyl-3-methyl-5-hydroxy-6-metoxy-1,4-benzoquinol methylase
MDSHQEVEVSFWKGLVAEKGDKYLEFRAIDWDYKTKHFHPDIDDEVGEGLEVGTGVVSIFEFDNNKNTHIFTIDPLQDEYQKIISINTGHVTYSNQNGEQIAKIDELFDFVLCVNVIDHTPYPQKMINQIYRVLKKGGKFYFEVNFDHHYSPAHYKIWIMEDVNSIIDSNKWEIKKEVLESNPDYPQDLYHAILIKK